MKVSLGLAALLAVGSLAAATAPSSPAHDSAAAGRPIVLAAASLTEVLPRIEPDATYSFGGSNQLSQQIRLGAPFDVFFSASPIYTQGLFRDGLVRKPVTFASNSLVVLVPKSNPAHVRSVYDLARRPRLRLVVAGPAVPIGLYTRQVLRRLGLIRVLKKTVSLEPDVKGVVAKVALGEADAGFVYRTDATPVASRVRVVGLPRRAQPTVRYELAIASKPADAAAARRLVRAVLGADGRRKLRAAGFGLP